MISYAEIALNIPFGTDTLTYEIPQEMDALTIGMRVEVPLRNKKTDGIVIDISQNGPAYTTKKILRRIDKQRVINDEQIQLARWMKDYYLSSYGEALFKMIPAGRRNKQEMTLDVPANKDLLTLNEEQSVAFENIKADLGKEATHLIYGITGSGKTEIYIHLMNEILSKTDKSAIFLVPEISLTVQTLRRLELIFGKQLALLHSALKVSERFSAYMQLFNGKKRIVVGTRSAIFAPVKNLGLIIIDEEHDQSYKEHSTPRYHTRQIAMQRSKTNNSVLVMGSATPTLELFFHAKKGNIKLNVLKKRANSAKLSSVRIYENEKEIIGQELLFQIKQRLDRNEQVIILLNRRGHSPLIYFRGQKKFAECPNCSSNLCFHKKGKAICHLCGHSETLNNLEQKYGEPAELIGTGTQRLEEYLLEKFKGKVIERLDQDATRNKQVITDVIGRLLENKIDILTGTQMIAKGLDASRVTLVGIINAAAGLGLPDFRSTERVYSLLTQVAGRAGRSDLPGEVIIETSNMNHPVIQMAKNQNYEEFFYNEIKVREDSYYPPFCRLARLLVRSKKEDKSLEMIGIVKSELDKALKEAPDPATVVLGPAPCPFYKIDSNYRNHILIKTKSPARIKTIISEKIKTISLPASVYLEIDFDPIELV
ncbi:MAG: primosomal protein N' [Leptospira sp.]|nr:primosomal protein N' [Leptospira sp.]